MQPKAKILLPGLLCMLCVSIGCMAFMLAMPVSSRADEPTTKPYPQPSLYPISWELTLKHSAPKRIVVQSPAELNPAAYWYVTYHVANNSERDNVLFYPHFDMMMEDGKIIASDKDIPPSVFSKIKGQERIPTMLSYTEISGSLRQGDDQARDGVAIWKEPDPRMGTFSIFLSGFWGEATTVKVGDKNVILQKSMQLTYHLNSDESHPGSGNIVELDNQYVMR
jgi:hypothetical protein